jgi:hypothetical protein
MSTDKVTKTRKPSSELVTLEELKKRLSDNPKALVEVKSKWMEKLRTAIQFAD